MDIQFLVSTLQSHISNYISAINSCREGLNKCEHCSKAVKRAGELYKKYRFMIFYNNDKKQSFYELEKKAINNPFQGLNALSNIDITSSTTPDIKLIKYINNFINDIDDIPFAP